MPLASGARLGPCEIVSPLGAGGMGDVYRARDTRLGRSVAVKVLLAGVHADAARLARFEQEARTASQLNHPNIVALYDVGTHEGRPFIITELLQGVTLHDRLAGGALPLRKAIDYTLQIARGLAAFRRLLELPIGVRMRGVTWSADGRSVLFGQDQSSSDIVLFNQAR